MVHLRRNRACQRVTAMKCDPPRAKMPASTATIDTRVVQVSSFGGEGRNGNTKRLHRPNEPHHTMPRFCRSDTRQLPVVCSAGYHERVPSAHSLRTRSRNTTWGCLLPDRSCIGLHITGLCMKQSTCWRSADNWRPERRLSSGVESKSWKTGSGRMVDQQAVVPKP